MDDAFELQRSAAMSLLAKNSGLTRKAGSFLGQCAVDPAPLTAAQKEWLDKLLSRAGLAPLQAGGAA